MNKSEFIEYSHLQLKQVFMSVKEGTPDDKLKHRTEGFMLAGEKLGVITRADASNLIEKAHFEIFGESSSQRAERKKSLSELKESSPDEYFDIPAIERRK